MNPTLFPEEFLFRSYLQSRLNDAFGADSYYKLLFLNGNYKARCLSGDTSFVKANSSINMLGCKINYFCAGDQPASCDLQKHFLLCAALKQDRVIFICQLYRFLSDCISGHANFLGNQCQRSISSFTWAEFFRQSGMARLILFWLVPGLFLAPILLL